MPILSALIVRHLVAQKTTKSRLKAKSCPLQIRVKTTKTDNKLAQDSDMSSKLSLKMVSENKEVKGKMTPKTYARFIRFLKEELAISQASIAVAEKLETAPDTSSLPMILWQYGLVSLEQLDKIFDWLETAI